MADFDTSWIGDNTFDPRAAGDALSSRLQNQVLPGQQPTIDSQQLHSRLMRKLWEEPKRPGRVDYGQKPPPEIQFGANDVPVDAEPSPGAQEIQFGANDTPAVPEAEKKPETPAGPSWGDTASDIGKSLNIGFLSTTQHMRELIDRIPGVGKQVGEALDAYDKKFGFTPVGEELEAKKKDIAATQSQRVQEAKKKDWWDEKKGWFGDAWSDPYAYMTGITESIPEEAVTMLPGIGLAKWAYRAKLAAGATIEAASKLAGRTAAISGAVSEGLFGGAATAIDVRQAMNELKPEILAKSEGYQALLASGKSPEEAKRLLVEDAATRGFLMSGVITGMFGGMGDRAVAKILTERLGKKTIPSTLKAGMAGALGEGVFEEFPQSYGQKVAENIAIQSGDPNRPTTQGALNEALGGLATGGLQGGAMGAGAHALRGTTPGQGMAAPGGAPGAAPGAGAAPGGAPGGQPGAAPAEEVSTEEFLRRAGAAPGAPPPGTGGPSPGPSARPVDPATMNDRELADAFTQARADMGDKSLEEILQAGGYAPDTIKNMDERAKVEEAIGIARAYKAEEAQKAAPPGAEQPAQPGAEPPQPPPKTEQPSHEQYATLRAYGYTDEDIANMPPTQRSREVLDAKDNGIDPKAAMAKFPMPAEPAAPTGAPIDRGGAAGTREKPATPQTAEDVKAAQPAEPKSAAQAEAENYTHVHLMLPQFGLTGKKSISVETGVGQTRKGVDPDGKPWSVKMEGVAYGRLKGTKGADGQPLDILLGPNPTSPHVFVVDQHDPKTRKFDEHKILAGFDNPMEALRGYASVYTDKAQQRIGHVVAMGPQEFEAWLAGDTTKPLKPTPPAEAEGAGARATEAEAPKETPKPAEGDEAGRSEAVLADSEKQIEQALGPDVDNVLPVTIRRAAEIMTEQPGIGVPEAFAEAFIETAVEQGYVTEQEAIEDNGPAVKEVLEAGRPPEDGGKDKGERAEAGQEPTAGGEDAGVGKRGGKAERGEPAAGGRGRDDTAGVEPDTKRAARDQAVQDTAAAAEAADHADIADQEKQDDKYSRGMEDAIDKIEEAVEAKDRPGVEKAVAAAREYYRSVPKDTKAREREYWSAFPPLINKMLKPGYVTAKQEIEAEEKTKRMAAQAPPPPPPVERKPIAREDYAITNMLEEKQADQFEQLVGNKDKLGELLRAAEKRFNAGVRAINDAGFKVAEVNSSTARDHPEARAERRKLSEIGGSVSRLLKGMNKSPERVAADMQQVRDVLEEEAIPEQLADEEIGDFEEIEPYQPTAAESRAAYDLLAPGAVVHKDEMSEGVTGVVEKRITPSEDYDAYQITLLWHDNGKPRRRPSGFAYISDFYVDKDGRLVTTDNYGHPEYWTVLKKAEKELPEDAAKAMQKDLPKGWTVEPLGDRIFIRGPNAMPLEAAGIENTPEAIDKAKGEVAKFTKDKEPYFYRGMENAPPKDEISDIWDDILGPEGAPAAPTETIRPLAERPVSSEKWTPAEQRDYIDDILGQLQRGEIPEGVARAKLNRFEDVTERDILNAMKPPEVKPRTAPEAGKAAAKKISKGALEALKGLDELFSPKGKLGSGPTFDDETYAKAKPFFKKAAEEFAGAWADMKEFAQLLAKALQDHMGWTMDRLRQLRPYLEQFTRDVRDGIIKFAKGETRERAGTEVAGPETLEKVPPEQVPGAATERPAEPGTPGGSEPRAGRDRGVTEEGVPGARGPRGGAATDTAAGGERGRRAKPRAGRKGAGVSEEPTGPESVKPADGPNIPAINFRITDELALGQGSEAVKFRDNIAAIELVKQIDGENRRATPDEQKTLARYVGWGGLANAFRDPEGNFKDEWRARGEELERLLSPDELRAARASTRNAHYTSKDVVDATWAAVKQFGFKGGLVLEPSAGSGNFLGLVPEDVAGQSKFVAVEYDPTTARIAALLYPQETVLHSGFHQVPLPAGEFTLAIGNPPFGSESLTFQFNPAVTGLSIHNQFFVASLDALRPGGVQAMVVSRFLMDAQDPKTREILATKAKLLGAIRLPDTAFKENARTEVVTDIVFLQRRTKEDEEETKKKLEKAKKEGETPWDLDWINTGKVRDPLGGADMVVNKYFARNTNRDMIIGRLERSGSMYGAEPEVNVKLPQDADMRARLYFAVGRMPHNVMDLNKEVLDNTAKRHEQMSESLDIALSGQEPGHVTRNKDSKLTQVIERETASGAFEPTRRIVTPDSPWSRQLIMDKEGQWYSMEPAVEAGKKVKEGKRNVYVRKYYPDNKVPGSMRLGDVRYKKLNNLVSIRDLTKRQLVLEAQDAPAAAMEANRKLLADFYNGFVAENGLLNDPVNLRLINDLPDGALIAALETGYREAITTAKAAKTGQTARPASAKPAAILSRRVVVKYEAPTEAKSPADALSISMSELGRVDMDRIGGLLGKTPQEAADIMTAGDDPLTYHDPETGTYETPSAYLSGNVARKLKAARAANIDKNVAALEKVQPERWSAENVTAVMGANWIPAKDYQDFASHLLGGPTNVSYSPATNAFAMTMTGRPNLGKYEQWGTKDVSADQIINGLLNSRVPKVVRREEDRTYVDQEATALVAQKAREMETEFADWVFADTARRNRLVDIYNDKFNTRVTRQHDGSHLTLPGKVPDEVIKLRRHQKNAVWRGIYEKSMLLDHVVGAGKTFTAIARAMERRRMGLSKKPTIVVPNHLVDQWAADVYRLYPAAKVLAAGKNQFDSKNRRRLFAKIATGDWDIVIVPHSSFGFIDIAPETETRFLEGELRLALEAVKDAEAEAAAEGIGGGRMKPFTVKEAERLVETIRGRMEKLKKPKERLLTFEQMGIDDITVDEAHEFKNLFYSSRLAGVRGMGDKSGSQKAFDLYNKIRVIRENPNGTVTFMTGTPISNSAVEMYTMMRYLAPDELKELGLDHFDAWRTQSVSAAAAYEPTESGGLKEVTRLGRTWSNMRSLMELYYSFTDAVSQNDINRWYAEDNNGARFPIPKVKGGGRKEVVVQPTPEQTRILQQVVAGFNGLPGISDPIQRNAERLRLMDRARKVSLDARAVDPRLPTTEPGGKLEQIANNVLRIYRDTTKDAGTQLVFIDRSVPSSKGDNKVIKEYDAIVAKRDAAAQSGDEAAYRTAVEALEKFNTDEIETLRNAAAGGWNAYQQLKDNLIAGGIPAGEIRFVQEANNDLEKKALFDSVNSGEVRVLIGSTPRMGAGTNVQERLVALHHGDVTWKPSDIEQREGRIIRQGNELLQKYGADNFEAEILAYVTERTVDAKMWDLNATKLRMINGIRNYDGSFNMEFADEDSVGMAEIAALASGDPLLMERVKLASEIEKIELLERAHRRKFFGIQDTIEELEQAQSRYPQKIEEGKAQAAYMQANIDAMKEDAAKRTVDVDGKTYTFEQQADARTAFAQAVEDQQAGDEKAKYAVMVGGKRITNKEAFGDVMADTLGDAVLVEADVDGQTLVSRSKIAQALNKNLVDMKDGDEAKTVGSMFGYQLELSKLKTESGWNIAMSLTENGRIIVDVERDTKEINALQTRALFDKLERQAKDVAEFPASGGWMQKKIDEAEERLPHLREQRDKPFAEAEKLKEKRARLAEVTSILDARTKASEARQPVEDQDEETSATVGIGGRSTLPNWSPEKVHAVTEAVKAVVRHRLGDAAVVRFMEGPAQLNAKMTADWGGKYNEAVAFFNAWSRVIALSIRPDLVRLTGHEVFHGIYKWLMTDHDRNVLAAALPTLRKRIGPYLEEVYQQDPSFANKLDPEEVLAIANEMYDRDRLGKGVHVGIRRIFEKVKQFLRDMAAAVRRAIGKQQADEIFGKMADEIFAKIYEGGYRNAPFNPIPAAVAPADYRPLTYQEEMEVRDVYAQERAQQQEQRQTSAMIGPQQPADQVMDRLMREFMSPAKPRQLPAQQKGEPLPARPGEAPISAAVGPGGRQGPPRMPETISDQLRARAQIKLANLAGKLGPANINTVEWRTRIQDRFIRIRNVERSVNNYNTALSTYQAESLMHGRTGQRLEVLEQRRFDPLIKAMHDAQITLGEINAYLYARHAPERNAWINPINPALGGEGSGMSNQDAADIISNIGNNRLPDFIRIAAMVDAITAETRANLVAYGLVSQDTVDAWEAQFQFYVPLRGFEEASENDTVSESYGMGLDQRAKVTKEAFGRRSLADGPLQYVFMQAESAIIRGEKNRVGNTYLRFIRSNPDPVRWQVNAPTLRRGRDPRTGMVTYYADFRYHNEPDAFVTRVGGKPVVIRHYGKDGLNIARALKNMEATPMNAWMNAIMMMTTIEAKLNTAWNPEFMIGNLERDIGEAFINLNEQQQRDFIKNFGKHLFPAMRGIFGALREPGTGGGVYGAAFREFDKAGGRIRFFGLDNPDEVARNIHKIMRRLEGGTFNNVMGAAEAAGKAIEMVNGAIENATRLAAYMAARDAGMSIPDAAYVGRTVTIDFNKQGEWGRWIKALYMFGGAAIQGIARMGRALMHKNVRKAVYGLAGMGALSALYSILAGGNDDDGESYYSKIPPWVRDKNMIIMWPKGWGADGMYGKIWMPVSFAPFYTLGARTASVLLGQDKAVDAAWHLLSSVADAFNPLGQESNLLMNLVPSLLRAPFHIATNVNWTGRPIYPDRPDQKQVPDSMKSFRNATPASKWVAETANSVTGGDRYKSGLVDVHPGTLDHIVESTVGGVGRFVSGLVKTGAMALNGEFDPTKTPILRRFVGSAKDPQADAASYYRAREEVEKEAGANLKQARKDLAGPNADTAQKYIESHQDARTAEHIFKNAEKQMSRMRKMRERAEADNDRPEMKRIEERMREIQNDARQRYKELKKPPAQVSAP